MKTLLKFEADWCGPCQQIKPVVTDVLEQHPEIDLKIVDIDQQANHGLVQKYGVRAIPTLVLLDEAGDQLSTFRGAMSRSQLEHFISEATVAG